MILYFSCMQKNIAADYQCMSYIEQPSMKTNSLLVVAVMAKAKIKA